MTTVSVFGASGYSGAELLRLLSGRSDVSVLHACANTSAGIPAASLYPSLAGMCDLTFEPAESAIDDPVDIAFVALPSGEAMNLVPRLLSSARHVIDLGGDFRLPSASLYEQYYRHRHASPHLLPEAVYGLPELNREAIASARLIANPGCYPTSVILALLPALLNDIISADGIVINSLSGITGAGRSSAVELSFSEINENIRAYKIGTHQHIPEIRNVLAVATGRTPSFSFIPHLVPMNRGIYTTIHAKLTRPMSEGEVRSRYSTFYANAPFVRLKDQVPQIRHVVHTNFCDIAFHVLEETQHLVLFSAIDNLLKGAAGQAMQNMNIVCGEPEEHGLTGKEMHYVS